MAKTGSWLRSGPNLGEGANLRKIMLA